MEKIKCFIYLPDSNYDMFFDSIDDVFKYLRTLRFFICYVFFNGETYCLHSSSQLEFDF